jgi:MFS family permease
MIFNRLFPRRPTYYGWVIVAVLFLIAFTRAPVLGLTFGVFIKPMTEEFGWSRSLIMGAFSIGTLTAAIASFFAGRIVDRYGSRILVVVSITAVGLAYFALAGTNGVLFFYIVCILGRTFAQSGLGEGMVAAIVSKWFVIQRGKAIGFAVLGSTVGAALLVILAQLLINSYGWRTAWLAFGALTLGVAVVPAAMLLRRTPEDMGLLPDGVPVDRQRDQSLVSSNNPTTEEYSWTLRDAAHNHVFWLLSIVGLLGAFSSATIALHLIPYFTDRGINVNLAVAANSIFTVTFSIALLGWSFFADRFDTRLSSMIDMAIMGAGIVLIILTESAYLMFLATAVYGIGQGGWLVHVNSIWGEYYGRHYLGSIRGLALFFNLLGNALGPLFSALVFDMSGQYFAAFISAIGFVGLAILLLVIARRPKLAKAAI